MRLLASFVMSGRWQAVTVTTVFAALSILAPPLGIVSSAAEALVTLRQGMREGMLVAACAALASALLVTMLIGNAAPVVGFLLILWLPAWLLAAVLRSSRSLPMAVQSALLFGVAVIAAYYAQFPDPIAQWRAMLGPFSDSLIEAGMIPADQGNVLVELLAPWMTGVLAAVSFLQLVAALVLARWWQASLYNPGGFRKEFHGLRLHRYLAYVTLPVLAWGLTSGEAGSLLDYAALLLMSAYLVQGLALAHCLAGQIGASTGWLVGLYVLLLFMPRTLALLAAAGYADAWFNFRARFRGKGGPGGRAV